MSTLFELKTEINRPKVDDKLMLCYLRQYYYHANEEKNNFCTLIFGSKIVYLNSYTHHKDYLSVEYIHLNQRTLHYRFDFTAVMQFYI